MHKDLNVKKILTRFSEVQMLDEEKKLLLAKQEKLEDISEKKNNETLKIAATVITELSKRSFKQERENPKELIYTKSDICKEVARLKPYLRLYSSSMTTVNKQDLTNKELGDEEKNSLSDLILHYNKRLCEQLREKAETTTEKELTRLKKEKEGWVFEVFYRTTGDIFANGFVLLTEVLELYCNLTFEDCILKINFNDVKRIKYFEEKEYLVMEIRHAEAKALQVGFLNEKQFKLFDRLLFLVRNMARTSSSRLFQNQLLRNIYSEY